jgi:hypothetical protein
MNPDVASAIDRLLERGLLSADVAAQVGPVARGERVSVRTELRVLLYGGVLLIAGGVGKLVQENLDRLGPLTVAVVLGLAAFGCLVWTALHGPAFSKGEVVSPHLAFDYVLLLGVLLAASDLAYVEVRFTPLGDAWPYHFLIVAALSGALAFRYDSRMLFSVALGAIAAWRGVTVSLDALHLALPGGAPAPLRDNALACGLAFLLLGVVLARGTLKPHFEAVATHLGVFLALGALLSGSGPETGEELGYTLALLIVAFVLAIAAAAWRRYSLFVLGTLGAYIAFAILVVRARPGDELLTLILAVTSLSLVAGLVSLRKRFRESA